MESNPHEIINFDVGVLKSDHKRFAYQEGREVSCRFICYDGEVMVSNVIIIPPAYTCIEV
mgnify:CR=1 FL=1